MSQGEKLEYVVSLMRAGIITRDQAIEILNHPYIDYPMELIEMSLP